MTAHNLTIQLVQTQQTTAKNKLWIQIINLHCPGCNHLPEIGSGLNCIGNNCDPLKALCFRPHNTSRSRLGRYSPEIFNPCLQPSLHYWFLLNYDSKDLQSTRPSFSFSFSQMSTDVYVFPTQSWKHHQSQDIILRLKERETLLTRFQSLRPSSFSIRAARKERIGSFDLIVMINILHLLPVHGTSDQALWSYDHTRYSNAVVLYPKPHAVTKTWGIIKTPLAFTGLKARQFWFDVHSFVFAWYVFRSKSSIPRLSVSLLMSGSIKSSLGPNSRFAKRTSYPHPSVHLSVSKYLPTQKAPSIQIKMF